MEINLVEEAVKFMVLGMTIVFVFLLVLVQVMKLQAIIINKFFPEKTPETPANANNTTQEAHHVAAIVAAVAEFRKQS